MREIEPKQTFTGRRYEVLLWDDEEEISVRLKSNGSGITGIIGPLNDDEYPELLGKVSKTGVDHAARRLINELIAYNPSDYGFSYNWSDNFPIQRYYPLKERKALTSFFAELLRSYLKPSGEDGSVQPGDITSATQDCLQDLVDPSIKVTLREKRFSGGNLGLLWRGKEENSWEVEVDETQEEGEVLFTEGHEAGHLLIKYFLEGEGKTGSKK